MSMDWIVVWVGFKNVTDSFLTIGGVLRLQKLLFSPSTPMLPLFSFFLFFQAVKSKIAYATDMWTTPDGVYIRVLDWVFHQ